MNYSTPAHVPGHARVAFAAQALALGTTVVSTMQILKLVYWRGAAGISASASAQAARSSLPIGLKRISHPPVPSGSTLSRPFERGHIPSRAEHRLAYRSVYNRAADIATKRISRSCEEARIEATPRGALRRHNTGSPRGAPGYRHLWREGLSCSMRPQEWDPKRPMDTCCHASRHLVISVPHKLRAAFRRVEPSQQNATIVDTARAENTAADLRAPVSQELRARRHVPVRSTWAWGRAVAEDASSSRSKSCRALFRRGRAAKAHHRLCRIGERSSHTFLH